MEINVNAAAVYPEAEGIRPAAAGETPEPSNYNIIVEKRRAEQGAVLEQSDASEPDASNGRWSRSDADRSRERIWEEKREEARRLSRKRSLKKEQKLREQQRRQMKYEQEVRRKRRARYVRIMEESSWKRKLQSQEAVRNYYQSEVSAEVVSFIVSDRSLCQGRTDGCVRCVFSGNEPEKLDTVYYTYYSPEGLRCIREGERNPSNPGQKLTADVLQWEILLEHGGQYEAVAEFLAGLPEEEDLCFTASEGFWREFLDGLVL